MSCYLNMSTIYSTQHLSSVFQLWFEPIISKPNSNSLLTIIIYLHDSASYIPWICYCPNYTKPPLLSVSQSSTLSTVYTHLSTYTSSCLSSLLHLYIWHPNPEREEVATPACPIASYLNMSLWACFLKDIQQTFTQLFPHARHHTLCTLPVLSYLIFNNSMMRILLNWRNSGSKS